MANYSSGTSLEEAGNLLCHVGAVDVLDQSCQAGATNHDLPLNDRDPGLLVLVGRDLVLLVIVVSVDEILGELEALICPSLEIASIELI